MLRESAIYLIDNLTLKTVLRKSKDHKRSNSIKTIYETKLKSFSLSWINLMAVNRRILLELSLTYFTDVFTNEWHPVPIYWYTAYDLYATF